MFSLPVTRASAIERLANFQTRVPLYAGQRNFVQPSHPGVSRLSVAIRHRLLTEREVLEEVAEMHGSRRTQKFVQEVCWRLYYKGWLEMRPQVWASYQDDLARIREQSPKALLRRAAAVAEGRSGVAVMDAFARELNETGYLHNHARMWWASFWIHVERLPWQLGADVFLSRLHDGDPASNTLGWRWVAGLHTAGKTYLVRHSNVERLCDPSYLQDQTGIERLDDHRVTPAPVRDFANPSRHPIATYPTVPLVSAERLGVWLHGEDCHLESSPLRDIAPDALAAFSVETDNDAPNAASRKNLHEVILTDGVARAGRWYGVTGRVHDTDDLADAVAQWAERERLRQVVTMAPFVGPLGDALPGVRDALRARGVSLTLMRRPWDQTVLPFATSGFFRFFKRVTPLLPTQLAAPTQQRLL